MKNGAFPVSITAAPYNIVIKERTSLTPLGGGVILGPKTILTAKHVVKNFKANQLVLYIKTNDIDIAIETANVANYVYFKNDSKTTDDLVILKLTSSINFDNHAKAVKLAPKNKEYLQIPARLFGFGQTDFNKNNKILHEGLNFLHNYTNGSGVCTNTGGTLQRAIRLDSFNGSISATGDSGSPLVIKDALNDDILVGIAMCSNRTGAAFGVYYDWIKANIS